MNLKDKIQALKSKIDESKSIPEPESIWTGIEMGLDKKRKNRTIYFIVFLALLSGFAFYLVSKDTIMEENTSAGIAESRKTDTNPPKEKGFTKSKKTELQKNIPVNTPAEKTNLIVNSSENEGSGKEDKTGNAKFQIEQNINSDYTDEIVIDPKKNDLSANENKKYPDTADQVNSEPIDHKDSGMREELTKNNIEVTKEQNDSLIPKQTDLVKAPDKVENTIKKKKQFKNTDNWKTYAFTAVQFNQMKPYSINTINAIGNYFSNYSIGLAFQKKLSEKMGLEGKVAFAMLPLKIAVEFINDETMETQRSANLINMRSIDFGLNLLQKLNQKGLTLSTGIRINMRTNQYHFIENLSLASKTPEKKNQKLPEMDDSRVLRKYNFSLNVGLNQQYKKFLFGFNYTQGLSDISASTKSFNPISYCQLTFGYRLF